MEIIKVDTVGLCGVIISIVGSRAARVDDWWSFMVELYDFLTFFEFSTSSFRIVGLHGMEKE